MYYGLDKKPSVEFVRAIEEMGKRNTQADVSLDSKGWFDQGVYVLESVLFPRQKPLLWGLIKRGRDYADKILSVSGFEKLLVEKGAFRSIADAAPILEGMQGCDLRYGHNNREIIVVKPTIDKTGTPHYTFIAQINEPLLP